jgi:beta-mannosidase
MARYFKPPKDVESELLLSQFQHGMAMKMACEGWRAQRPRCMGTLFWQLNDNWPVASWSSIEYGGKWKPVQHMARRFYAPVAVVALPETANGKADLDRGSVFALNDTAETIRGELDVEYWSYDGDVASAKTVGVTVPPDSSEAVADFAAPSAAVASVPTFLVMTFKTAGGTFVNDWHFGRYRDMPLAQAKLRRTVRRTGDVTYELTVTADRPAFFVWANVRGVRGEFDDNCLTLLPGRPRTLVFTAKEPVSPDEFQKRLTVVSLADLAKRPATEGKSRP